MSTQDDQSQRTEDVVFQSAYGSFQKPYLWFVPVLGVIGIVGVPVGIFYNEGWMLMSRKPIEPWAATVIIEVLSGFALATVIFFILNARRQKMSPQHVVVTDTTLIVPTSIFASNELVLPLSELDLKVFDVGFVKQLQIKHKRRKILLSSARFPTNADFDALTRHLPL